MSKAILQWRTAVIVSDVAADYLAELKNALFYSDKTIFAPLVLPSITLMTRLAEHILQSPQYRNHMVLTKLLQSHPVKSRIDRFMIFDRIISEVNNSGLSDALVSFPSPDIEDVLSGVLASRDIDNKMLFLQDLQYSRVLFSEIALQVNACFTDCDVTLNHLTPVGILIKGYTCFLKHYGKLGFSRT